MEYILSYLYYDWFSNKNYWFDKDAFNDLYLSENYFKLIKNFDLSNYTKQEILGAIILLDQIPRHHKRINNDYTNVFEYSKKAIFYSELAIKLHYDNLNIDELCFVYLPYRHINDVYYINIIINKFINIYKNSNNNYVKSRAKKFIYNTLNNIYEYNNLIAIKKIRNNYCFNLDILENKTLNLINNKSIKDTYVYKEILNSYLNLKNNSVIIVSISGGVDSNLALFVLKHINSLYKNKMIKIIPIHINYANRIVSNEEMNFVNYYCYLNDFKLISRTISEINRNKCVNSNTLRTMYEDITKKIRFSIYEYGLNFSKDVYVLLGHNKDDCFENIITNISSRKNYDNLSGMTTFTKTDKLILWRPMLNIYKDCIIETALLYNIPFLKDSTPSWSMRGKIRNTIKKDLISLKNDNDIIETFFELKNYLLESHNIINTVIIGDLISKLNYTYTPKLTNITVIYNKHEINCLKYYNICFIFFKKINISISSKTIKEFIYFIKKKKNTKIYINKNIYINKKFTSENENFLEFFINETN